MHIVGGLFCSSRVNRQYVESDAVSEMWQMYRDVANV